MIRSEILHALQAFKTLPAPQLDGLARAAVQLGQHAVGAELFVAGDVDEGLFFALPEARTGLAPVLVRLELPTGPQLKPVRFERIVEGELFGETEWLLAGLGPDYVRRSPAGRRRETRAQLMSAAEVFLLPHAAMLAALDEAPALRQRLTRTGALRLKSALTAEARRRHVDGDAILAEYLLDLAEDHHGIHGNYAQFVHKVTQEEISADLGISRRALSDRLRNWVDAGLVRTTPLEILDIRRLRQLERLGRVAEPVHIAEALVEIGTLLDGGDLIGARTMGIELLRHFPASPDLAYAAALASARAGRDADAHAVLAASRLDETDADKLFRRIRFGQLRPAAAVPPEPPERQALRDIAEDLIPDDAADADVQPLNERPAERMVAELLALQGRLAKEAALRSGCAGDAARSAQLYGAAAAAGSGAYAMTNAALMAALAGDRQQADALGHEVLEAVSRATDYWGLSSRLEAQLLLGEREAALQSARRAMATPHTDAMVATTRRQLRRLTAAFQVPVTEVLDVLAVKQPFVFCGTMIRNQFADADEIVAAAARGAVAELLDDGLFGSAFGALAQGADILFAEAALELGIEVNAVLPFGVEDFLAASVADEWVGRFNAVIASCTSVTIAQPGPPSLRNLDIAIRHGFRCAGAQALERGADLETDAILLAVNAPGPFGAVAGTTVAVEDWRTCGGAVRQIDLGFSKRVTAGADHEAHGYRHMLFHFPYDGASPSATLANVAEAPVIERQLKDGRQGAAVVLESASETAVLAFRLKDRGFDGRIVCSYGPVLNRAGLLDAELVAALAGATDFPGFPRGSVLAALPFAREVQFARSPDLQVARLGQRAEAPAGRGTLRIAPTGGVYELQRY